MTKLPCVWLLGLLCANALAGDVICNPAVDISAADVKEIFQGEKQLAGGVRIVPVDNAALQDGFTSAVTGMDKSKYQGLWIRKSFRDGLTTPAVKGSDAEVIAFVRANAGAIGYVSAAPAGVKLVKKY